MRNPLPHLALAALILAPVAAAAPEKSSPLAFKRDDWKVVEGSIPAIQKACAGGTLAVTKAQLSERQASACAKMALNCAIPLSCVRFGADGAATVSPVDKGVLELTLYHAPFGKGYDYRLNRGLHDGKFSPPALVRDPNAGELMAAAAPLPVPPGDADHQSVPLTDAEKYWLTKTELTSYENQSKKPLKPAERVALDRTTREQGVTKQLPSFARAGYTRLVKAPLDPAKVSFYLDSLIAIRSKKNLDKLAAIKKGKGPAGAGLQRDDALQEYEFVMSHVPLGGDKRPLLKFRGIAVKHVLHFRALIRMAEQSPAPGKTPDGPASTAVVDLLAPELDWLMPDQRNAYTTALSGKPSESERGLLDKKNRSFILENLPKEYRAGYEAAVAEMKPDALEAAIAKAPHWAGRDTELDDKEVAALDAVKNAPAPKDYGQREQNTAKNYYLFEMSRVYKKDGKLVGSSHLQAHEVAVRYRAMLAAAGKTPGTDPNGPETKVPTGPDGKPLPADPNAPPFTKDDEDLKGEYDKEILQAAGDKAKIAAIQDKYKKKLQARRDFDNMTDPKKKKKFCEGYQTAVVNGSAADKAPDFKGSGSTAKAQLQSMAGAKSDAPVTAPADERDPYIKSRCAALLNNAGAGPTPEDHKKTDATVDSPLPCGAKKAAAGADPSAKAGTDSEKACEEDKPFDSGSFYKNLANGAAFGLFGLVLGSFFGGPLLMLGVAAAAGLGGFMISKHLNPDEKKKKK